MYHPLTGRCEDGQKFGEKWQVSGSRIDWCNPKTFQVELFECRVPGRNPIRAYVDVEEEINGMKFISRCTLGEDGHSIHITSNEKKEAVEPVKKSPGVCSRGTMMWIPRMQWESNNFVEHCDPKTLQIEIIACRSPLGTFVPVGSNLTESENEFVNIVTDCTEGHKGIRNTGIVVDHEKMRLKGCAAEDGMYRAIGDEWVMKNRILKCTNYNVTNEIGCLSTYGSFVAPNEKVTEMDGDRRFDTRCMKVLKRVFPEYSEVTKKADDLHNSPPGRIVAIAECRPKVRDGAFFIEDKLYKLCEIDHRGKQSITVVSCITPNEQEVLVGEHVEEDGMWMACKKTEKGGYVLNSAHGTPVASMTRDYACRMGIVRINITFIDGGFKKVCVHKENPGLTFLNFTECILPDKTPLPVGEKAHHRGTETEYSCVRVGEYEAELHSRSLPETGCEDGMQHITDTCENGMEVGQSFIDNELQKTCELHIRRAVLVVTGCVLPNGAGILPVGERKHRDGFMYACKKVESTALLIKTEVGIPDEVTQSQACTAGVYKANHTFIEDNFEKKCVMDAISKKFFVNYTACILPDKTSLPVGQGKLYQEIDTGYLCMREGANGAKLDVRIVHDAICSDPDADGFFKLEACKNGLVVGDSYIDNGLQMTCISSPSGLGVALEATGCVLPGGEILKVGEEKRDDRYPPVVFFYKCEATDFGNATLKQSTSVGPEEGPPESVHLGCLDRYQVRDEWVVDNIVKKCVEVKEYQYEIKTIGCVTAYGNFLPIGANATEYDSKKLALPCMDSFCIASGDSAIVEHKVAYVKRENGEPRYQFMEIPVCENGLRNGYHDTRKAERLVYTCKISHRGEKKLVVTACLTLRMQVVQIGKNVEEDGQAYRCVAMGDGRARLEAVNQPGPDSYLSSTPTSYTRPNPVEKLTCENGLAVGDSYIDNGLQMTCISSGRQVALKATGCVLPDGEILKVGEAKRDGFPSGYACVATDFGNAKLRPIMTIPQPGPAPVEIYKGCLKKYRLGEEWVVDNIVKKCVQVGMHRFAIKTIGCVSAYGNFLPIGANATEYDSKKLTLQCMDSFCIASDDSAIVEHKIASVKRELGEPRYTFMEIPYCENGLRNGYHDVRKAERLVYTCKISHRGEKKLVVTACLTPRAQVVQIGKSVEEDAQTYRCVATGDGRARLEALNYPDPDTDLSTTPASYTLPNPDKSAFCKYMKDGGLYYDKYEIGEKWIDSTFRKECIAKRSDKGVVGEVRTISCIIPDVIELKKGEKKIISERFEGKKPIIHEYHCLPASNNEATLKLTTQDEEEYFSTGFHENPDRYAFCEEKMINGQKYEMHKIGDNWTTGRFHKACFKVIRNQGAFGEIRVTGCLLPDGTTLQLGSTKTVQEHPLNKDDVRIGSRDVYECKSAANNQATLVHIPTAAIIIPGSTTERKEGEKWVEKGVVYRSVADSNGELQAVAQHCIFQNKKLTIGGPFIVENNTRIWCEKKSDGVILNFALHKLDAGADQVKLSEEACIMGLAPINQLFDVDGFRMVCLQERETKKFYFQYNDCILPDGSVLKLGTTKHINELPVNKDETSFYECKPTANNRATLALIHPAYDKKPRSAKGRKEGEEWEKKGVVYRSVADSKGELQAVAQHCVFQNKKLAIGGPFIVENNTRIWCERKSEGVIVNFALHKLDAGADELPSPSGIELLPEQCENGKRELEEWSLDGVHRACLKKEGRLTVVAFGCTVEKELLIDVGSAHPNAEGVTVHCERKGKYDAQVAHSKTAKGLRKAQCSCNMGLGEQWSDENGIRRHCQLKEGKRVEVALGCYYDGENLIRRGEKHVYPTGEILYCVAKGKYDATVKYDERPSNRMVEQQPTCENGKKLNDEWTEEYVRKACLLYHGRPAIIALECNLDNGDELIIMKLGDSRIFENGLKNQNITGRIRVKCKKDGELDALVVFYQSGPGVAVCQNGKELEEEWSNRGVRKSCLDRNGTQTIVALGCVLSPGKLLGIGRDYQLSKDEYTVCRAEGAYNAYSFRMKVGDGSSFVPACDNGRKQYEEWSELMVHYVCEFTSAGLKVKALGCQCGGNDLTKVGASLKSKYEANTTCTCVDDGNGEARIEFITLHENGGSGLTAPSEAFMPCENGKKETDEWLDDMILKRCNRINNVNTIVSLGCFLYETLTFVEFGQTTKDPSGMTMHCERDGEHGAVAFFTQNGAKKEKCENGKVLEEKWTKTYVVRVCREVHSRPTVVALGCMIDDGVLIEVGKERDFPKGLKNTSELPSLKPNHPTKVHCNRLGEHDASISFRQVDHQEKFVEPTCANGKRIGDQWSDGLVRRSCLAKKNKPTIVALGCEMANGGLVTVGGEHQIENHRILICKRSGEFDAEVIYVHPVPATEDVDCGKKQLEAWEEDRFLKKCHAIEENVVIPKTFGCVTPTGAHVMEGEEKEEEGVITTCYRNQHGKMEVKYEYIETEE